MEKIIDIKDKECIRILNNEKLKTVDEQADMLIESYKGGLDQRNMIELKEHVVYLYGLAIKGYREGFTNQWGHNKGYYEKIAPRQLEVVVNVMADNIDNAVRFAKKYLYRWNRLGKPLCTFEDEQLGMNEDTYYEWCFHHGRTIVNDRGTLAYMDFSVEVPKSTYSYESLSPIEVDSFEDSLVVGFKILTDELHETTYCSRSRQYERELVFADLVGNESKAFANLFESEIRRMKWDDSEKLLTFNLDKIRFNNNHYPISYTNKYRDINCWNIPELASYYTGMDISDEDESNHYPIDSYVLNYWNRNNYWMFENADDMYRKMARKSEIERLLIDPFSVNEDEAEETIKAELIEKLTFNTLKDIDPFFLHPEYSGLFAGGIKIPYFRDTQMWSDERYTPLKKGIFNGDKFTEVKQNDDDDSLF